ncbi:hypothetical protein Tco_1455944 [Tanacetum coccineum]
MLVEKLRLLGTFKLNFSTLKTFGGKTRDLVSILEETGQEYDFTQKKLEELLTEGEDGVRNTCDAIWNQATASENCDGVSTVAVIRNPR